MRVLRSAGLVLMTSVVLAGSVLVAAPRAAPPRAPAQASGDLDTFMQAVLARRDENWKKLQQYVLDEQERVEVRGPSKAIIWGEKRDFTWYLRDGFFVRSPVSVNGVAVPDAERRKYEAAYLRHARARDERGRGAASPAPNAAGGSDASASRFILETRQPEFIDSAYFLKFKFEPGHYALVGRETLDGKDVLRIEYYPARLFSHEQDMQQRREAQQQTSRSRDAQAEFERMMNKVSLVTLWVEPTAHQIVKYTFDNVDLDFLPAAWLVHIDDATAMMTMGQPFPGVWLPRDLNVELAATLAAGSMTAAYHVDYDHYREAKTSTVVRPAPDQP